MLSPQQYYMIPMYSMCLCVNFLLYENRFRKISLIQCNILNNLPSIKTFTIQIHYSIYTITMNTKFATALFLCALSLTAIQVQADEQSRKVDPFTEISLRIGANLHIEQGDKQSVEITAKPSTMEQLITEVKDGKLIIRFPNKTLLWKAFQPGDITINITTPTIHSLGVVGSGDIIAEDEIKSKIIELDVNGSGNIKLSELSSERVKTAISGSGNIIVAGKTIAQDLSIVISGSGNFRGLDYRADDVSIKISGSGNADIEAKNNLYIRLVGAGIITYKGNPKIDQAITGSGVVKSSN